MRTEFEIAPIATHEDKERNGGRKFHDPIGAPTRETGQCIFHLVRQGDGLGHCAAAAGINWHGSSNAMPNLYGLLHLLLCILVPNCANRHKVIKLGWLRIFAGAAIGQLVIVSSINIPTSPNKIIFRSLVYFLHGIHCCYALRH